MSINSLNYYKVLEVNDNASAEEIKKSYRRLSMKYHPDKNLGDPSSQEKFQKISEAYEILGNTEKKQEYDMSRNNPFIRMMGQNMGSPMSAGDSSEIHELFSSLFGMPFGSGMGHHQTFHGMGINGINGLNGTSNIRVFHNGVPVNLNSSFLNEKPTAITVNVTVDIDKILTGTTVPVEIERWIVESGNKVFEKEIIYVTVPQGIDDGEMITIKEKGNTLNENSKGDIKVFVKIINPTLFKRQGLDLIFDKEISIKEALCGFSFELKYITGKTYTITNNSGNIISNEYKKLIPNMGIPRDGHLGNLIIHFHVKFPEVLSIEVIQSLKEITF
jgi:DnaJ-class molecular chaperone